MNNHFKCIGIVGHPRHPTALTTHEMLYRWLCTKGYEVIVEQQIAHELQLKNVKTGTLAEIGQLADLAVVVGPVLSSYSLVQNIHVSSGGLI